MDRLHDAITKFRQGLGEHWGHIGELRGAPGFVYDRLAEGRSPYHPLLVLGVFAVIALLAWAGERAYRRSARRFYANLDPQEEIDPLRRLGQAAARFLLNLIGVAIFAAGIIVLFLLLHQGHTATRLAVTTLLMALLVVRLVAALSDFFFCPGSRFLRIAPFSDQDALLLHRWIVVVAALTAFGILLCGLMLQLGLPDSQHLLLLDVVGIAVAATLIAGAFRARKAVADSLVSQVSGDGAISRALVGILSSWHLLFTAYVIILYSMSLYTSVTGGSTASYPGLMSLLVLVLFPAVDFALRTVMDRFLPHSDDGSGARKQDSLPVFKRAARILLIIFAVFLVGRIWGVDFFALGKQGIGEELVRAVVDIALTLLAAYVGWGVIKTALARYLPDEDAEAAGGDEGGASSAGRLETIMPLVMRFVQITLAVIVAMIILSSLGVDIAPLLAGAGVVGIAVGFGAQSLVRDVVSGLFFLMDDAFRKGEYVDIGSVKGTVESINVRSLVMRHHLGPLHTVPYGEIQHLTNFSRDWVIMKMEFRVPTDTDINKVKKLFKQIGADMLDHPELGGDFIEPFKSQGVKSIEDSAIIVRGKFMAKPGKQFVLRKELYNRVQKSFQENGIEFAHRKVTVELPRDIELTGDQQKRVAEAAGAAALAAEEADRENSPEAAKA